LSFIKEFDVIILGAGGAGLMCAIKAGARGRRVAVLDHSSKLGRKILISGGGRCNFTNVGATADNYVSENPHFAKSALSRFTPADFIELVKKHGIAFHEKKLGQLFCDGRADQIVELLRSEAEAAGAEIFLNTKILSVKKDAGFEIETSIGRFLSESLVVATGGLSIPKIGATGFGFEIAKQFEIKIVKPRAALDGFVLNADDLQSFQELSGVSIDASVSAGGRSFRENFLFTHKGLSGPAMLQASLYWEKGSPIEINLLPERNLFALLKAKKSEGSHVTMKNLLKEFFPERFSEKFCGLYFQNDQPLDQIPDKKLEEFSNLVHRWVLYPAGTVGYEKAEVTRGGVDTQELSSKTMESLRLKGLYFIGEVVDVTGQLGGYNFQWAWASGAAAGTFV
jgi:predicted Rossmann fold flavoprotein